MTTKNVTKKHNGVLRDMSNKSYNHKSKSPMKSIREFDTDGYTGYDSSDSWENVGRSKLNTSNDSDDLNASIFSDNSCYPDNEEYNLEEEQEEQDEETRATEVAKRLNISRFLIAPMAETGTVKCALIRSQQNTLSPKYTLYVQDGEDRIALVAIKKRTSTNYHIFDMSRGAPNQKNFTKKSGNYMGKLQGVGGKNPEYSLFTNSSSKQQLAAFKFTKVSITKQLKVGQLPRRLHVMLPAVNEDGVHTTFNTSSDSDMLERYKNGLKGRMEVFCTKEPTFERGQYRLNFRGRVTTPSVKNFQIVHTSHDGASQSPNSEVIVQFGRVSDNTFHLDFKKPFNMFQAFGIALAQFDL